jgi:DNA-binding SARP family transcriptional activator
VNGRLCLFGPMRVEAGGQTITVPRGDAQRVLAYLALHPSVAHRREVLTETLWPDAAGGPRRSLSDTLYRLRQRLGDGWVVVDTDTVALRADVSIDVREFDRRAASRDAHDLDMALAMYDELTPAIYDDWALEHRAARRSTFVTALRRRAADHERAGNVEQALLDARRLIAVEPFDEAAQQTYLRLLGRLHRYGEALAHYESFVNTLAAEVGVAPDPATTDIVARLRSERGLASASAVDDRTRFVGRIAERSAAVDAIEAAFEGRGSVLCVEGVSGIGKSHLLAEIVSSARWRGAIVSMTEVHNLPEASSLSPLARVLEPLLSAPVRVQLESDLDPMTLGALGALRPEWRVPGERAGEQTRDDVARVAPALRALGDVVAKSGTVVLVVDDLQWASASMWERLAAFADGFVPGGGLLVGAYRRPDVESSPGWSVLQGWDRRGFAAFVSLRPFGREEIAELLAGDDTARVDDVLAVTGGVPFHVTQWLRGDDHDRRVDGHRLTMDRLVALDPNARRALEFAAVLGETLPFRTWAAATSMSPLELGAVSDRLVADRWITPTESGHAFTHDLLREAVYEHVAPADRTTLHAQVAGVVADLEPGNSRTLAYHLDRAGEPLAAARAYADSGRVLRGESAFGDALVAWERALELLPQRLHRERMDVALDVAALCDVVNDHGRQLSVLGEAIASARTLDDQAALLRGLLLAGGAAARTGDLERAEATLAEAVELATKLDDLRSHADAIYRHADLLVQRGRWREAEQQFLVVEDMAVQLQDEWLRRTVTRRLATAAAAMGRHEEAAAAFEQVMAEFRADGDGMNEVITACSLAWIYQELGAWDRLRDVAERALPLAHQFSNPVTVGLLYQNLSFVALAVGDRDTASALVDQAEECWAPTGREVLVAVAINERGLIAEDDGDLDTAGELYATALEMGHALSNESTVAFASHDLGALSVRLGRAAEAVPLLRVAVRYWVDTGNEMLRAKSEAILGLALLALGESAEAADLAASGLELARRGTITGEQPQAWLWALSQLLDRLGRRDDADEVLEAARRELVRQAGSIADPERRRGFFERVPLHRDIVAASDARTGADGVVAVRLAHAAAPLGRTLRPDEFVDVRWTLHAADDDAITDPADRRRHRLRRLLDEAARSSAAPTDDDLAGALGVSRRTILRDMARIGGDQQPGTRRRSRAHGPASES